MPTMGWEYAQEIARRFGLREEDVMWALDDTLDHLKQSPSRQGWKYTELLPPAAEILTEWLEQGHQWPVDVLNPADVAQFICGRAPGCTWAVMQAKIKSLTPEDRFKAGLRLLSEWMAAQQVRRTAVSDLHRRIDEMEANNAD